VTASPIAADAVFWVAAHVTPPVAVDALSPTGFVSVFGGDLYAGLTENVERVVVSALIAAAVLGVRLLTGWAKRRDGGLSSKQRLLLSTAVAGATAVGALSLLAVWDRSGALLDAYRSAVSADRLSNVVLSVVLLASAYAVTDFLSGVIRELSAESTALSDHQEEVVRRLTQLSVYTFALLIVSGCSPTTSAGSSSARDSSGSWSGWPPGRRSERCSPDSC